MKVFGFLLIIINLHECSTNNELIPMNCGIVAYKNLKKYFIVRNNSCYIPQTNSSVFNTSQQQMFYTKLSTAVLLFRLISGSGVNLYDYFTTAGDRNQTVKEFLTNNQQNFRSILLDEWDNVRPVEMNIIVRNYNDQVAVKLSFYINIVDTLISWYNINNLYDSFPWGINFLKSISYSYFYIGNSINGRTFYMNLYNGGCGTDTGLFGVFKIPDPCTYGNQWRNGTKYIIPQIVYVSPPTQTNWNTYYEPLKSMEIIGKYNSNFDIYA